MIFFNVLSYILTIVGGLNWGLFGVFGFNLVGWIFGGERSVGAIIVYVLVALAAVWLIISPMITGKGLIMESDKSAHREKKATENNFD